MKAPALQFRRRLWGDSAGLPLTLTSLGILPYSLEGGCAAGFATVLPFRKCSEFIGRGLLIIRRVAAYIFCPTFFGGVNFLNVLFFGEGGGATIFLVNS